MKKWVRIDLSSADSVSMLGRFPCGGVQKAASPRPPPSTTPSCRTFHATPDS